MIRHLEKIFTGLIAGLVVMAGALPAIAQVDKIQLSFKAPTPQSGQAIRDVRAVAVQASAKTQAVIKSITLRVQPNGGRNSSEVCEASEAQKGLCWTRNFETGPFGSSQAGPSEDLRGDWDTNRATPFNGVYDLVAIARSDVPGVAHSDVVVVENLKVDNLPDQPRGFSVSAPVRGDPKLTLNWSKNPEPDISRYEVRRKIADGDFEDPKSTGSDETSLVDAGLPFDQPVRYQLVAFRKSPVSGEIASAPVTTSAVTIQSPPPPPSPTPSASPGAVTASPTSGPGGPKDLSGKLGEPPASGKAVKPVSLAARDPLTGPRRDGGSGFGRLLPFGKISPPSFVDEEFAQAVGEAIRNPGQLVSTQLQVNPLRFIAAAALLLVTAGHLGRGAHSLFKSAKASSATSPAVPV